MTNRHDSSTKTRETWKTPVIRNVVPVDRTRGGTGDIDDQDDIFYNLS